MSKKLQKIKVRDYGDAWINRLAIVMQAFAAMSDDERGATLRFINAKYPPEIFS